MRNFTWRGKDGLTLAGSRWGDSEAPSIIFTHGAGQTRHSWGITAEEFAGNGYQSITVDTRGHGDSDWAQSGDYSIESMISDLGLLSAQLPGKPVLVGASLGGITSLIAVGEGLISCAALVLVDVAPKVDQKGVARILSFMRGHLDGFESLEAAQAAVTAYNPNRSQAKASGEGLRKNLRLRNGRYHWHWDPVFLEQPERSDPKSMQEQEDRRVNAAANIDVPVLLVRGAMSDIVSEESAKDLQAMIPHSKVVEVSKAGHMVAGESNQVFARAVMDFVNEL